MKQRLKLVLLKVGLIPHTIIYWLALLLLGIIGGLYEMLLALPSWLCTGSADTWFDKWTSNIDFSTFDKYPNKIKKLEKEILKKQ